MEINLYFVCIEVVMRIQLLTYMYLRVNLREDEITLRREFCQLITDLFVFITKFH